MLAEIKDAPILLKFLIAAGVIEIFFTSSAPDRIGINPHAQTPLMLLVMIILIIWLIFGEGMRKRTEEEQSEPAE